LVALVAFFLLYLVLPNTKVNANAAVWGAAVAALVWTVAKWLFGMYVTRVIPYNQIYGVLGLIPLSVFWIFVTWLIVLFGLQLTFTTQHLTSLDAAEISAARKTEENFIANDVTVINIVREIAAAFQSNQAPVSPESICSKLDIPGEFGERILNHLVDKKLVAKTSDPSVGYLPAKDLQNIRLGDIAEAVAAAGYAQRLTEAGEPLEQIVRSQREALAKYSLRQILTTEQHSGADSSTPGAQIREPS
jgi:DNA-binding IscR family transcriptional regulator